MSENAIFLLSLHGICLKSTVKTEPAGVLISNKPSHSLVCLVSCWGAVQTKPQGRKLHQSLEQKRKSVVSVKACGQKLLF